MTKIELELILRRTELATPGPWHLGRHTNESTQWREVDASDGSNITGYLPLGDASFIASARTDIPKLIQEIYRLREALEDLYLRPMGLQDSVKRAKNALESQ